MFKKVMAKTITSLAIIALLTGLSPQATYAAAPIDLQAQLTQLQSLLAQLKALVSGTVRGATTVVVNNDAELSAAIAAATGGETIQLAPGTYNAITAGKSLTTKAVITSRDANNPAVVKQVTVSGSNWHINNIDVRPVSGGNVNSIAVNLTGANGIFENSTVIYGNSKNWTTGADWLANAATGIDVKAQNVLVKNNYIEGVYMGIEVLKPSTGSQIISNTINGDAGDGIRVLADNTVIEKNFIKNMKQTNANHSDCMQSWGLINNKVNQDAIVSGVTVRSNICLDTDARGTDPLTAKAQGFGAFDSSMQNWTVENNVYVSTAYHGMNYSGAQNMVIKNNTIIDSDPVANGVDSVWLRVSANKSGTIRPFNNTFTNNISNKFPNYGTSSTVIGSTVVKMVDYDKYFKNWQQGDVRLIASSPIQGVGANLDPATVGSTRTITNPSTGGGTPTPTPAPTLTLGTIPTSVTQGGSATLTWTSTNATACTASGAWSGSKSTSGSQSTGALNTTGTQTFSMTCTGAGGSASKTTSVSVTASGTPTPTDSDSDGVADTADNCPLIANTTQANNDGDTQGDACDTDDDNDGILDVNEKTGCQFNASVSCGVVVTPPTGGQSPTYNMFKSSFLDGTQTVTTNGMTRDVAFDSQGNVYVTGGTQARDFPTTAGAYDTTFNTGGLSTGTFGTMDVFLMKFSPNGTLLWSTLIGGGNYDRAYAVEVGPNDDVFIGGRAGEGFPTTAGTVQPAFLNNAANAAGHEPTYGKQNGFVAKFDKAGKFQWATYMTAGIVRDIDVDNQGNVHIAPTQSQMANPHITANAFQKNNAGSEDGMYVKISGDGKNLLYGTYIGGSGVDGQGPAIRVDAAGNAYWNGNTASANFPIKNAFQSTYGGGGDVAVVKFAPDGSVVYSSYLGGSANEATETHGMAVDTNGNAYVGFTTASNNITTKNGFDTTLGGATDGYVARISPTGQLLAATYVGGSGSDTTQGITFNNKTQQVVVSGQTKSSDHATAGAIDTSLAAADAYIGVLSADLSKKVYVTLVGGSGDDDGRTIDVNEANGRIALGGQTASANFPAVSALDGLLNSKTSPMFAVIDPSGAVGTPTPTPTDTDGDGIADSSDNCRVIANTTQANNDGDTQGDACDTDDDNDGILDVNEKTGCQFNASVSCGVTPTPTPIPGGGSTGGGSTPSTVFTVGTKVMTTDTVNVRPTGLGSTLGTQIQGARGVVLTGTPVLKNGYVYVNVNFDGGVDGWVADTFLTKVVATRPTEEPKPVPETPSTVGTRVMTTDVLNVRTIPNGAKLGTQVAGAKGTQSTNAAVKAGDYSWVYVDFDNSPDGYVVTNYLSTVTSGGSIINADQTRAEIKMLLEQLAQLQALLAQLQ